MLENFPRLLALPLYRDGGGSTWVPHWASITLLYCACPAASLQETSECAPHLEPGTQVGSVVDVWGQVVIYVDGKWKSEHRKSRIWNLDSRHMTQSWGALFRAEGMGWG